jgi:hypothetical protein
MYPKSRRSDLLIDQVGDETIVYDQLRQEAHSLNRLASIVWRQNDGTRSVEELAELAGAELGAPADQSIIEYALDKLATAHLLEGGAITRRDVVRRMTFAGAAAVALPVVLSIAAPTAAMAASGPTPPPDPGEDF